MQYRESDLIYETESEEQIGDSARQPLIGKQYRDKRPMRVRRRPAKFSSSHPGCGMGARRKHRWTW
jgi:hypothetical protein